MSHMKRMSSPRTWPVPRKGTKYLTSPYPGKVMELSMPLNLVLRDLLKIALTRKEVRIMLHNKDILVDGIVMTSEKFPVGLFDVLSIPKIKKNYRLIVNELRRIDLEEIADADTKTMVCKVIGKKSLTDKKTQINLFNGRNVLSEMKVKTNDSVVIDLAKGSVLKHLALKEGAKIFVIGGSHLGQKGTVEKMEETQAIVKSSGESFPLKLENIYVLA